jgi:hypothetical protein
MLQRLCAVSSVMCIVLACYAGRAGPERYARTALMHAAGECRTSRGLEGLQQLSFLGVVVILRDQTVLEQAGQLAQLLTR